MNTANVSWNSDNMRWEATFNGMVLVSVSNPGPGGIEYIRNAIEGGRNQRARKFNVTKINVVSTSPVTVGRGGAISGDFPPLGSGEQPAEQTRVEDEFDINERFSIMEDYVSMVANRHLASTVITGEGGLGKSFTVMKSLRAAGLQSLDKMDIGARTLTTKLGYTVVKGYSTAKALFRTLYDNRNHIIVFDDCDSILRDPNAVNVLKAALDSYDVRTVTWNSEGFGGGDDDLPRSFEFTGGVIFISNMPKDRIPQAIRSRAVCADVCMTRKEVIERMKTIVKADEFLPDFDQAIKMEAMDFVAENAFNPLVKELNLRSLINVAKTRAALPDGWKRPALYAMANT